ncbi:UNVERIFIED_CONTAM: hypothetical protein GTU68_022981 [Idotea baltica]|nr:hypothetical protein [Idotea baltica]
MNFKSWVSAEFKRLQYQDPDQLALYCLSFPDVYAIEENLTALLDVSESEHRNFLKEFLKRYKEDMSTVPGHKYDAEGGSNQSNTNKNKGKDSKVTSSQTCSAKKKNKYVSLYSEEGANKDVILLPGRQKCDCQATKHKLINNCLKCGRIVCEQEGSGPCSFCQALVISKEEKEIINRGTKKSESLHNKLIHTKKIMDTESKVPTKGLQRAIDHKNKLLEFDKTSEKRTNVFDDESDYFQSSSKWINPADREKLQKMEEEMKQRKYDRNNTKYTIDLLGRKVTSEHEKNIYDPDDPILKEILQDGKADVYSYRENEELFQTINLPRPVYVDDMETSNFKGKSKISSNGLHRLQDRELKEMRDEGLCLSMHQPWASLLIAGIKIHEGRNWYHSHRGRLWIASAAKPPTPTEITQLEQMYRVLLKNEDIKFPQNYPTSCLLGCVDVVDVLPQEEYRGRFPEGESESPYVFVCEHPQEMIIKFPIKGEHKIYKLDSKVHLAAQKSLKLT